MITLEWLDETNKQLTDVKQKAIFKVLSASYQHWYKLSCQTQPWPYNEYVKEMLWDCEVALLAFTRG